MEWLAMAIRRSLPLAMKNTSEGPERQSNADTRMELERLGKRVGKVWAALFDGLSSEANDVIWDYAVRHSDGPRWEAMGDGGPGFVMGQPPLHSDYTAAMARLDWLSGFLQRVAREIPSQRPRWTQAEWREIRIKRGQLLATIYESAFGRESVVAVWPEGLGYWPDFYQRAVALACAETDTPDLEGVLNEARRRHKATPVIFSPDYIPEYRI
jgi:hypothetical protein